MVQRPCSTREHAASSRNHNTDQSAAPGSSRFSVALLLVAALLLAPLAARAGIIHVDAGASGTQNGNSWLHAYTDLQSALAAAGSGDEIWVAAGLYKPTSGTSREASFQLKNGVAIYGGFAGNESQRSQRNPEVHLSVLSGDIDNNDTTDVHGMVIDADDIVGDNSFHVVTGSDTDTTAILDGFVITAGLANGGFVNPCGPSCGGGIYLDGGSPTLANILFIGNQAFRGGGLHVFSGEPSLANVRFSGNHATGFGGGMSSESGDLTLTDATFSGNRAGSEGGGMYLVLSSPSLTNVTFSGNQAVSRAGGMAIRSDSIPILTNVSFSGNQADQGGGVYNARSAPILTNVSFSGNHAASNGGGMYNAFGSNPLIRNTIVWNNRDGSGVGTASAAFFNDQSSGVTSTPQISDSLAQGCNPAGVWTSACGSDEGNNLPDVDPLFISTPNPDTAPTRAGNLRLQAGSPALDAGNNGMVTTAADLVGNVRIVNSTVDLGPFERPASACPTDGVIHVDRQATGPGDGKSWTGAFRDLQDALMVEESCELWVAAGIYKPVKPAHIGNITESERLATFQLRNGIEIYGGFAGNESQRDQRDWEVNTTVLSGDIDNNDLTNASGVVGSADDLVGANSINVTVASGTDATAVLDGFVITAGLADGTWVAPCGPNCGGGMYSVSGSPTLANLHFSGNRAGGWGGAMYNRTNSNPTLTNVSFSGNSADWGGGMYNRISSPTLTNISFSGNRAGNRGGGMYNRESSDAILTNVSFSGNHASEGGGMYNQEGSAPVLTNVSFSGNDAGQGGGMYNGSSSHAVVRNTIFWHNRDSSGLGTAAASIVNSNATTQISYSLVQGQNPAGQGNLDGTNAANDPLFVLMPDPDTAPTLVGNLRLMAGSPALNAGINAAVTATSDLAGNARIVNGTVDLGPYEMPSSACPGGGVIHVDQRATAPGDGTNWESAFRDLQDALRVEEDCQLWVAAGVYKPVKPGDTENIMLSERLATFELKNGIEIYGGFAGNESQLEQRDWQVNLTVLSGDIDNNDSLDARRVVLDANDIVGDNSFHVVTSNETDATAVLDGFFITAGLANGDRISFCIPECGGGLRNVQGSPTLANITVSGNRSFEGGGIHSRSGSPSLTNVRFIGNSAGNSGWGGGMYATAGSPILTNVSFDSNRANLGGGMAGNGANAILTNVSFNGNQAFSRGGGLYNVGLFASPTLTNVSFSGNSAGTNGGGMVSWNSAILTNVSFSGNRAGTTGGGLFAEYSPDKVIRNTIFWNNRDNSGTGTASASITLSNDASPQLSYSLVHGCNPAGTWNDSCGSDNGNNLPDADPLFVNTPNPDNAPTSAGDLRLRTGSPAIDAGNDDYIDDIDNATDLDGNPRRLGEAVDLGPFESNDPLFRDRFDADTP
jgi:predicted outer membrane repeat protein